MTKLDLWVINLFKSLEQVKGIVKLIPNSNVLSAFQKINRDRLKPLFLPDVFVEINEDGEAHCSECNYRFEIENKEGDNEADYAYCVNCLRSLTCCGDNSCYKLNQDLDEAIEWTLEEYFRKTR